jgi:hypothetical protein
LSISVTTTTKSLVEERLAKILLAFTIRFTVACRVYLATFKTKFAAGMQYTRGVFRTRNLRKYHHTYVTMQCKDSNIDW